MCFDFERNAEVVVEGDHARVVLEDGQAPRANALVHELARRTGNSVGQQIVKVNIDHGYQGRRILAHRGTMIGDLALQRLVHAVLGPGLRDCLQLKIRRVASQLLEMGLNRRHLLVRQEQVTIVESLFNRCRRVHESKCYESRTEAWAAEQPAAHLRFR